MLKRFRYFLVQEHFRKAEIFSRSDRLLNLQHVNSKNLLRSNVPLFSLISPVHVMPAAAKTSFAFFYFLVLLFVWFGSTRARDCWLKDQIQSSFSKCKKQCCGSDGKALSCQDTCNGILCTNDEDCDEGCCKWRVYLHNVCHDCPTRPPRIPTTPWNRTRSTTEQPTLKWTTRSTTEEPTSVKSALSNGQIRLVIGFGCAAVVVGVIVYYAFRYSKGRHSRIRRRRAVVVVEREPEINMMPPCQSSMRLHLTNLKSLFCWVFFCFCYSSCIVF